MCSKHNDWAQGRQKAERGTSGAFLPPLGARCYVILNSIYLRRHLWLLEPDPDNLALLALDVHLV